MTRTTMIASMVLILLGLETGCSTMTKDKGNKKDSTWQSLQFWKKGYQQPTKMVVLWSHEVLTVAGKPPTRGFGGRIYFYNAKSQTIPVEGELVVHGFDETAKKAKQSPENQPDKRFRFTQEQFTEHFSESDLGASYSVWIPWDAADGVQKEVTLIPTFVSSKGEMVQGASAKVMLPGRTSPTSNTVTPVQTVAYEQSTIPTVDGPLPKIDNSKKPAGSMRTTTIQVPGKSRGTADNKTSTNLTSEQLQTLQSVAANIEANSALAQAQAQARAQALAQGFNQNEPMPQRPVQSFSAWAPNNVPLASSLTSGGGTITPPNQSMPNQPLPQMQANPSMPAGAIGNLTPMSSPRSTTPSPFGPGVRPATDEELSLPPGVQLTPRSNAW